MAYDPRALAVYSEVGGACHVRVHDASEFCAPGEAVPFWTLQMRAQAAQQASPVITILSITKQAGPGNTISFTTKQARHGMQICPLPSRPAL